MFISFFLFKKEEQENNKNISIILETNEGNIEASTYPDKEYYEYSNINCKDTSDDINVNFNKETWKLNLSIEEEKVDGKFNCIVHFKQRNRLGTEVITSKYKENNNDGGCDNIIADAANVIADINVNPPANPSIPSDQLITVVTPKIQVTVNKN